MNRLLPLLLLLPLPLAAQDPAPPPPAAGLTPGDLIAALGAVVLLARLIVKLTPTPKDNSRLETVITWLKHIGLHLPALALAALLGAGCGSTGTVSAGYNPATGDVTAGAGLQSTNLALDLQAAYNALTQQPGALTLTLTFKAAPDAPTRAALARAGALAVRPHLYALALPDARDPAHPAFAALRQALYAGARVEPLAPRP